VSDTKNESRKESVEVVTRSKRKESDEKLLKHCCSEREPLQQPTSIISRQRGVVEALQPLLHHAEMAHFSVHVEQFCFVSFTS
jgi:hypothetical protein